jgi:hypothetical protein
VNDPAQNKAIGDDGAKFLKDSILGHTGPKSRRSKGVGRGRTGRAGTPLPNQGASGADSIGAARALVAHLDGALEAGNLLHAQALHAAIGEHLAALVAPALAPVVSLIARRRGAS